MDAYSKNVVLWTRYTIIIYIVDVRARALPFKSLNILVYLYIDMAIFELYFF